ncbi:MAG: 1-acyl-sn-glycerol-3-phosphate acyltransferase, partial [Chitinophagaceae bacterium]|nr:1-acyl-sn-glycerol-3-phosphate acyltransferase [Chitinophagaceae bacterium]
QYDENFELYNNYVVTRDHKTLLLFITPAFPPSNTGENKILLNGLDSIIDKLNSGSFKNIEAAYFGASAVSAGNALQLRKDSIYTQGVTVLFIVIFLGLYFRRKRAPFIILIPVVFGALFSLAAIYLIKGSISVIALGTGSVVLGIAVNYSLHVFNHYRHTRSIEEVIRDLAMPLTIGSITTIGGFLCLQFVESELLKDLGLFAAFSLIGASLCSLIFLPHFITSAKGETHTIMPTPSWIDRMASYRPEYNKIIIVAIVLLTAVFAFSSRKVGFQADLSAMNYMPEKLKDAEKKLNKINEYALQSVYLVTEGRTLNEALRNSEKLAERIEGLKERNIVKKYSGVSSLVISDSLQRARIERWNSYWTPEKKNNLLAILEKEGKALGFKPAAFERFRTMLTKDYLTVDVAATAEAREAFVGDFITEKPGYATVVTLVRVTRDNKQDIYNEFENTPQVTVVDKQYLTARLVEIINSDFTRIALMSSILVFTVLLITFGRIELALVSFIPMLITWIWILGIMGLLGIQFNIINIIISTLIFGLGDDYSLFIMDGLLREYKTGKKNLASYKSCIFLSAITTITGLGVLIFAKHPALRSIALISIIGILCVVIISQILIPFLFTILIKNRTLNGLFPWTFTGILKTAFAFAYFVFGCVLLTLTGLLFKLSPFNKEKTKLLYHYILSRFCHSLIYIMRNVKKQLISRENEDFKKPSIIIANHQSFLDILCMIMLHPKLILFTNNWVWSSPVFGSVVRMADYYPAAQGAENSLDLLKDRVKNGYSIVIFPEGTRSADGSIKRFHKGAFFLAEKLQLDILPILIHGTGYTMTKGDFLLKDGRITLKFLPRIRPLEEKFGNTYTERAKQVGRYFKEELAVLKEEVERPVYFSEQLIYNYLYKGPVVEWYLKVKLRLEKYYQPFHDLLPLEGRFLDLGCGYGFMAYMLHFASPGRNITAIDYDEEKISTAKHCFSKNETINFECADIMNFRFETYDAIILADMLHYLQPHEQRQAVDKCARHLNPGGTIIIREGNKEMQDKHKGTKLSEFFSTKLIGFNKTTGNGLSFLSASFIKELADTNGLETAEIDATKYTSNIIFILKQKQVK